MSSRGTRAESLGLDRAPSDSFMALAEKDFQSFVVDLARMGGWLLFHPRPARVGPRGAERWATALQGDRGWPDITFCHPDRSKFIVRELKSSTGRIAPEQHTWIRALRDAGIDAAIWRPKHKALIEATLLHRLPKGPTT